MKGRIVTLVGADGAGKTTQARRLADALRPHAIHLYMGSNPSAATHALPTTRAWTALKRVLGRSVHHAGPPAPGPTPRPRGALRRLALHLKSLLVVALRVSEDLHRLGVARRHARRGTHVILDRHPFIDYRTRRVMGHGGWMRWGDRLHGVLLERVYPRPEEVVVLDAPADTLFARKPEGSLEALAARRREYLELARALPSGIRVTVLDASAPAERITPRILERLGAAVPEVPLAGGPLRSVPAGGGAPLSGRRVPTLLLLLACCAAVSACDAGSSPAGPEPEGPDPERADTLTVMTFNIFHDGERARHGILPWTERRAGVLEAVRESGADVVGLQEAEPWQVDWLLSELPEYGAVMRPVVADAASNDAETVAVLYRSDRLEVAESGHFWYSTSPDEPGSYGDGSFGGLESPSMVTWVRLRDPEGSSGFYVYNTHLVPDEGAADADLARARSAELLMERIAERSRRSEHFLVTGDLNMPPEDPVLRYLLGESCEGAGCPDVAEGPRVDLRDAWASRPPDGGGAGTRCNAVTGDRGPRVDYVLVGERGPGCEACGDPVIANVDVADWSSTCPSDHRPVTVTVVLP